MTGNPYWRIQRNDGDGWYNDKTYRPNLSNEESRALLRDIRRMMSPDIEFRRVCQSNPWKD